MKRYGNLFNKIVDIDNIKLAHKNASKRKKHYTEVKMVDSDINYYCELIQDMLVNKTYTVSEYKIKYKKDKNKVRKLYILPYFPDRIIQHAIMQVIEPIWKKTLINDTFQSIKGRGIHKAKKRVEEAIRTHKPEYVLKIDVNKFYPSITNDVLKQVVRKKIKCKDTLYLLDTIITSNAELPIGNYMSQYLGNITMSSIDHSMKEIHKCKMYYRYCDDIVILGDKEDLHICLWYLNKYLDSIKLTIKRNYQIGKVTDGRVDFVGFVFMYKYTRLRKSIVKKLVKATETSIPSYFGWVKCCRARGLWYKHIKIDKEFKW